MLKSSGLFCFYLSLIFTFKNMIERRQGIHHREHFWIPASANKVSTAMALTRLLSEVHEMREQSFSLELRKNSDTVDESIFLDTTQARNCHGFVFRIFDHD